MTIHLENIDALNAIAPISAAILVVPDDGVDLFFTATRKCRGLWVGGGGNVELDLHTFDATNLPSVAIVFEAVSAGEFLPYEVKRVRATNTTATLIVACY